MELKDLNETLMARDILWIADKLATEAYVPGAPQKRLADLIPSATSRYLELRAQIKVALQSG